MAFHTFLLFIAVSILPALSPGPAVLLAISNALRYGAHTVFYSALGNALGLTALGFAVAFGLAAVLAVSATAFTILKFIGGGYLIYLGYKLWRDGKAISVPQGTVEIPRKRALFTQAFFISITNPKALAVLAAIIPPFIDHQSPLFPQVGIMSVSYALICFASHMIFAVAGGHVRRFMSSEKRITATRRVLGATFMGFGATLASAGR